jgi:hypothetical protein
MYVFTKCIPIFLTLTGLMFAGGQKSTTISVSAVVRPAARIEVQSATSVTVGVTMFPNVEALVWTAAGSCSAPESPQVISSSGIHHLSFSPEEGRGKNMVCLTSSDGVLRTFAPLPQ